MEIMNLVNFIIHYVNNSSNAFKLLLVVFASLFFIKYTKKHFIFIVQYLGTRFITQDYLKSFFDNHKIISIVFYGIPLFLINYLSFDLNIFDSYTSSVGVALQSAQVQEVTVSNFDMVVKNIVYLMNYIYLGVSLSRFLSHTVDYLSKQEKYKHKPLHSFSQIIFIVFMVVVIATIYAHYTNQSPKTLFTTLSVMSVAVFLTLKDVILGIVSTILIMSNNIVQVGDWIKNDKYNADGKIIEINLITVKVLNFDKTIVVIPTYSLVSEGFTNQQEIINSGLRRIKQVVRIDPMTIRYLNLEELEKYKKIDLLIPYIEKKIKKINEQQTSEEVNNYEQINKRYATNLGLFRQYISKYIEQNPMIYNAKNMGNKSRKIKKNIIEGNEGDIIVRIIEGNKEGVGLEIYCFSNDSEWKNYEYLVSTLLEHVYASAHKFGIRITS